MKRNVIMGYARLLSMVAILSCVVSCNNNPTTMPTTKVWLDRCVIKDTTGSSIFVNRGDTATLQGSTTLIMKDKVVELPLEFVEKFCSNAKIELGVNNDNNLIVDLPAETEICELRTDQTFSINHDGKSIDFSGIAGERFVSKENFEGCSDKNLSHILLEDVYYCPNTKISKGNRDFKKIGKQINAEDVHPIPPTEVYTHDNILSIRFAKDENVGVKIYNGLSADIIGTCKADGDVQMFAIDNNDIKLRIVYPNRLSYLITPSKVECVNAISIKDVSYIEPKPQNNWWTIAIIISIIALVFIVISYFSYKYLKNRFNLNSERNHTKSKECKIDISRQELTKQHPLYDIKYISINNRRDGRSQKHAIFGKLKIEMSEAKIYIEKLVSEYYPENNSKVNKFLNEQLTDANSSSAEYIELSIPYCFKEMMNAKDEQGWERTDKYEGFIKVLPSIDVCDKDTLLEKRMSQSNENGWEQLTAGLNQLSELVPGNLKPLVKDLTTLVDNELKGMVNNVAELSTIFTSIKSMPEFLNISLNELKVQSNRFEADYEQLQKDYSAIETEKNDLDKKLKTINEEHNNKVQELNSQHNKAMDDIKTKHSNEIKDINNRHQNEIQRLKTESENEMSQYRKLYKYYSGCQEYTVATHRFFDLLNQLEQQKNKLYEDVKSKSNKESDIDTFNYYYSTISNKYYKATRDLDIDQYRKELIDLDETGMTRTGKVIDAILKTSTPEKYVEDLRYRIYDNLFNKLCGAAIVYSDDLESLHKLCPQVVQQADTAIFNKITTKLLETTKAMGYSPVYVKLFTPYNEYSDVAVEEKINLEGTNKNDIVEVLEMAVNYGTKKTKTKVSANI